MAGGGPPTRYSRFIDIAFGIYLALAFTENGGITEYPHKRGTGNRRRPIGARMTEFECGNPGMNTVTGSCRRAGASALSHPRPSSFNL
jgi:hypothetical protein